MGVGSYLQKGHEKCGWGLHIGFRIFSFLHKNKQLSFHFSKKHSEVLWCLIYPRTIQNHNTKTTKAVPVSPYNINLVWVVWEMR